MKDVIELAKQAGLCLANDEKPLIERFAKLVRNAALEEVAALGRVGDRVKNPAIVEFMGEIYELKEPTP